MGWTLPILKFLAISFGVIAGVYALLHDFKKDGRVTKEGRLGVKTREVVH